jgi:hypothetical protein
MLVSGCNKPPKSVAVPERINVEERLPFAMLKERLVTCTVTDWIGSTRGGTSLMA